MDRTAQDESLQNEHTALLKVKHAAEALMAEYIKLFQSEYDGTGRDANKEPQVVELRAALAEWEGLL